MIKPVKNLAGRIYKIICKYEHDNKTFEACGIKYKNSECCLEYTNDKGDLILYKCLLCNKNFQNKFDENLKKQYINFRTKISSNLCCCCERVFTYMNTWIIGKNLMKHDYMRKKILTVTSTWEIFLIQIIST